MADANSFTIEVAAWLPADQWRDAADADREKLLKWAADRIVSLKRRELRLGIGADGKKLAPVKPESRPDNATGRPLDPHYASSRSWRLIRTSIGRKRGHITTWWMSGWGRILGYHADGKVRGAPVRDVIGLSPASERRLEADVRRQWGLIWRKGKARSRRAAAAANARWQRQRPVILPFRPNPTDFRPRPGA